MFWGVEAYIIVLFLGLGLRESGVTGSIFGKSTANHSLSIQRKFVVSFFMNI